MHSFYCTRRRLLALPAVLAPSLAPFLATSLATMATTSMAWAAPTLASEQRPIADFDTVAWDAIGELTITQTHQERLLVEAEPQVLRHIVTRMNGRRLDIGFAPGGVQTTLPIRFTLELRHLRRLELRGSGHTTAGALRADELTVALHGSGDLRIAALQARHLELRHAGAGDVVIGGGRVESQRVALEGSGSIDAALLDAHTADARLSGAGHIRLAAAQRLDARIDGSGDIVYRGRPQVSPHIHGAGEVRPAQR